MAVVIFKAIEKCNSNCIYCDVIKKHQDKVMDYELLKLIFIRMNEYLTDRPGEEITFTWHGGEVCLLGAEYFRVAYKLQEDYCPETKNRINHLVQSNLTLINQEIIDAFLSLGIKQIGSSFEPIHHIRGYGKNRDSELYNRKFIDGVKLLARNNMTWGVIYVVHRLSLKMPLEIFYYLTNLNASSHPNFNQIKMYGEDRHNLAISGEEFADFLGAIFPVWYHHRERYPNIQPFADIWRNTFENNMSMMCESSGQCTYRWVYVGPEGETSQCGRAGDYGILKYGNLKNFTFQEIMNSKLRKPLALRQKYLSENECKNCRFWGICHGGCPLDAFMIHNDFMKVSSKCDTTKRFIEKYFEPVTGFKVDFPYLN